jgi:hypothetical protein
MAVTILPSCGQPVTRGEPSTGRNPRHPRVDHDRRDGDDDDARTITPGRNPTPGSRAPISEKNGQSPA